MRHTFHDPAVKAVYNTWEKPIREMALQLRELVFNASADSPDIGTLKETLKWGQPSYLPNRPKTGTTIRIAPHDEETLGLYVPCSTTLISTFRQHYDDTLSFSRNRAVLIPLNTPIPADEITHCIKLALTYHLKKNERA